jgi:hypothetical protein
VDTRAPGLDPCSGASWAKKPFPSVLGADRWKGLGSRSWRQDTGAKECKRNQRGAGGEGRRGSAAELKPRGRRKVRFPGTLR